MVILRMAKTIIVTGASRGMKTHSHLWAFRLTYRVGIGLAIAEYLLQKSHNVVALARSRDPLEKLREKYPQHVRIVAGDLGDLSLAQQAVDLAVKGFGSLDGLIVNHGIIEPVAKIRDCKPEDWKRTFDVNLVSAVAFVSIDMAIIFVATERKLRPSLRFHSSTSPRDASSSPPREQPLVLLALGVHMALPKRQ